MVRPTASASSSTLISVDVATLKARDSCAVTAGSSTVLASTLARATSFTKT